MTSSDVIVIGGGFAGLSAASALAAAGARVVLLEARVGLGGRAATFTDPGTGERVDNGQHLLLGCYHETFAFLGRVGAGDHVQVQANLEVHYVDEEGRPSTLACGPLPPPLHLVSGLLQWKALRLRDRLSVLGVAGALQRARRVVRSGRGTLPARPDETVEAWLTRHGQRRRLRDLLWEPLALAALNQPVQEAAALPFVRVLGQMFGRQRRDAAIGMPVRPLTEMYAEPARRFIEERGGEVRVSSPAQVHLLDGRIVRVEVRGASLTAGAVVAAVPWFALPTLFSGDVGRLSGVVEAAARTAASPIVTVNIWFDRPVLGAPFVGLPGRTFQWVFDKRQVLGDSARHLSLVSSGAAAVAGQPNEWLARLAVEELCGAFPAAREASVERTVVVRERRATFSLAPGQPARPPVVTPVEGLFLAGDWTETGLPATIEGAVASGHRAARAVADANHRSG